VFNKTKSLRERQDDIKKKFPTIDKERSIEIFCPSTRKELRASNCFKCKYCQIYKGKHESNRILTSLICLFGYNNGSDDGES